MEKALFVALVDSAMSCRAAVRTQAALGQPGAGEALSSLGQWVMCQSALAIRSIFLLISSASACRLRALVVAARCAPGGERC